MHKFKEWFRRRFLPEWARDQLMRENAALRAREEQLTSCLLYTSPSPRDP